MASCTYSTLVRLLVCFLPAALALERLKVVYYYPAHHGQRLGLRISRDSPDHPEHPLHYSRRLQGAQGGGGGPPTTTTTASGFAAMAVLGDVALTTVAGTVANVQGQAAGTTL